MTDVSLNSRLESYPIEGQVVKKKGVYRISVNALGGSNGGAGGI